MECPKCATPDMVALAPEKVSSTLSVPHFFCKYCGREWTILSDGIIRTCVRTYPPEQDPTTNAKIQILNDSPGFKTYKITVSADSTQSLNIKLRIIAASVLKGYLGGSDWSMDVE